MLLGQWCAGLSGAKVVDHRALNKGDAEREYQQRLSSIHWEPPQHSDFDDGNSCIGKHVYVQGVGEGTIVGFVKGRTLLGSSKHTLEFPDGSRCPMVLLRKNNTARPWLLSVEQMSRGAPGKDADADASKMAAAEVEVAVAVAELEPEPVAAAGELAAQAAAAPAPATAEEEAVAAAPPKTGWYPGKRLKKAVARLEREPDQKLQEAAARLEKETNVVAVRYTVLVPCTFYKKPQLKEHSRRLDAALGALIPGEWLGSTLLQIVVGIQNHALALAHTGRANVCLYDNWESQCRGGAMQWNDRTPCLGTVFVCNVY